jgi:predicted AAA+ superfamily ATPase
MRYWRASTGFEVDFILGDMQVALEVKGSLNVHDAHTQAIRALLEEPAMEKSIFVSQEKEPRMLEYEVEVLPWQDFPERLWFGELVV